MTRLTFSASIIGLIAISNIALVLAESSEEYGILDCLYETNGLACAKKYADAEIDRIEVEVTGRQSSVTFSHVLEEAGALLADGARTIFGENDEAEDDSEIDDEIANEGRSVERQARKKKFGKKKKHLLKLIPIVMMFKAKIGLLLQLISTHFQLKFFVIAIVSLLINAARFWIDLKNSHHPAKVVYYEHAQHQHHYDHDQDDHHGGGYWGRSGEASPHELAYNGYSSEH